MRTRYAWAGVLSMYMLRGGYMRTCAAFGDVFRDVRGPNPQQRFCLRVAVVGGCEKDPSV